MFRKIRQSLLWKVLRIMVRLIIWLMCQMVSLVLFIIHLLISLVMVMCDRYGEYREWEDCRSIDPNHNTSLEPRGYRTINLERLRRRP